jgi:hypothetical protein
MDLRDLFEQHYADQNELDLAEVRATRLGPDSYLLPTIARAFRYFCAGFEANQADKLRILGYLSNKGVLSAETGKGAFFAKSATDAKHVAVYVKQCEAHKTGDMT